MGTPARLTVIFLAVALLGAGAWAWLGRGQENEPQPEPQTAAESEKLYAVGRPGAAAAVSLTVQNRHGSFTVHNQNGDDALDRDYAGYTLQGLEAYPLDTLAISVLMDRATLLEASAVAAQGQIDRKAFGLAEPAAVLNVTYADRKTATLLVGGRAGADAYYVMRQGEQAVYIVSAGRLSFFFYDELQFLDKTITGALPPSELITLELGGRMYESPVTLEFSVSENGGEESRGRLVGPVAGELGEDALEPLQSIFGLRATRIVCRTTGSDGLPEAYGLAEPHCTVRVYTAEGEGFSLLIAEPDANGYAYLLREGTPLIYEAGPEQMPWLGLSLAHLTGEEPVNGHTHEA